MRLRRLAALLGAVLITAVPALIGAPAQAADPLPQAAVALSSGTVLPGAPPKDVVITVTNKGPGVMTNLLLVVDWESFQWEEIDLQAVDPCEPGAIRTTDCHMSTSTLQVGETAEWHATLQALPGALGSAGSLEVWPIYDGNNGPFPRGYTGQFPKKFSFPLMVGEQAEGLFLHAFDVPAVISDDGSVHVGALRPGETGPLLIVLENRGDEPVGALTLSAKLPAGATFDQKVIRSSPEFRGCVFTDFRYAECDLTGLVLLPASEDPDRAVWAFALPVKVDAKAKPGVNLAGGVAEGTGVEVPESQAKSLARPTGEISHGLAVAAQDEVTLANAAAAANRDTFMVVVRKASTGGAGGSGNGGGGTAGGGSGGGLPITGPTAAPVAALGAAAVLLGVLLVIGARRRTTGRSSR